MEKREQPYAGCAPAARSVELAKCEEGPAFRRPRPVVDMLLAHRIRLDPTPVQCDYFARAAGTARRVWNWALAQWQRQVAAGQRPNAMALKKHFNAIKYAHPDWLNAEGQPWLRAIHRDAHSQPFANLAKAWRRYFAALRDQFETARNRRLCGAVCATRGELGGNARHCRRHGVGGRRESHACQARARSARRLEAGTKRCSLSSTFLKAERPCESS
ncbi:helix-turn-helix domain-containing protein [Massilia litorea]|uniref:helix-turn-helix domain-containing protein n=1 Tax=Massilia litorea TaxID=2769491 RepID=UPI0027D959D8|nr:helix-turn-helix domain-containing protein [Massilia litorea]